jgi:hypothetical protein
MRICEDVLPNGLYSTVVTFNANSEDGHQPLTAVKIRYDTGIGILTSYELSLRERLKVLFGGRVWLELLTADGRPQPQKFTVEEPRL